MEPSLLSTSEGSSTGSAQEPRETAVLEHPARRSGTWGSRRPCAPRSRRARSAFRTVDTARRAGCAPGRPPCRPSLARGARAHGRGRPGSRPQVCSTSSALISVEALNGDSRARRRISFACARPMPAIARWSRSSGWSWRRSRPRISPSAAASRSSASGPRCASSASRASGVSKPHARPLLLPSFGEHELPAALEAEAEHRRLRSLRAWREIAEPPGAHEMDAEHEIAGVGGEERGSSRGARRPPACARPGS